MTVPSRPPHITDDREFILRLDDGILRAVRCIKDIHQRKRNPNGGGIKDWQTILRHLIDHRAAVMTGRVPPLRTRQMKVIGRMFVDDWDPEDIDGPWAAGALGYYARNDQIAFDAEHYAKHRVAAIDAAIAEAPSLYELEELDYGWSTPDLPLAPPMRDMPHQPHRRSLMMPRDAAAKFVQQSGDKRAEAVAKRGSDFLRTFASQHLILAFTDHWLSEPAASIRSHLIAAAQAQLEALRLGWHPNAWEIFDCLHLGIVCAMPELPKALVAAAINAFADERIRPIDFLSWLNLSVLDMERGDDHQLLTHMHNLHDALFNREQPIEMESELPLWKASFEVLHALRHRQADSFNRTLVQRETERIRHYRRGGSSAPIALFDLHGLAWCAMAKRRGITPAIDHIYLPLAVLDPTGDSSASRSS